MSSTSIGAVLRQFREANGLTQEQLAKKAKVTRSYVAMLETGERKSPNLGVLQRLAKALGVSVRELLP
jgi:transcriptional regulator with XRE-family HTH domain